MKQPHQYIPGTVDDQILLLSKYRQEILELISNGKEGQRPEEAAYWMKKICESGCEVSFGKETSEKILQDLLQSIRQQITELRSLYADSSFYV